MNIKAVLFDLDGTLLPMDNDEFVKAYFGTLAKHMSEFGYEPKKLIESIWICVKAMVLNDGKLNNGKVFWDAFCKIYGEQAINDEINFEEYYKTSFQTVKAVCKSCVEAKKTIDVLKSKGIRLILATNPVFPKIATESRIRWAGLELSDFELITTYENIGYCKPNPLYYKDILERLKLSADECLMVGNDVTEDMVAKKLGINVFLHTDYIINKNNDDISQYNCGGFDELLKIIEKL